MFMIKHIQFRKLNNSFQNQLNEDIKQIKRDNKIFVPADKSRNIYKMDRKTYEKLSKSDIGKSSKIILDKIISDVLSSVQVNQWKNSQAVIEWFKNI